MSTAPQPPRPPVAPAPPRPGSNLLAIVLLLLALVVVASASAVWIGLRFLSRNVHVQVEEGAKGGKEVSIKTPFGSFEVQKDVNEASLGLPIYPGATRIKNNSATLSAVIPGERNVRIVVGKFETPDSFEKVKDFYQQRVGSEVTKFTEKSDEGKTVFEIKHGDHEKVVALKSLGVGTQIELVRVSHGPNESN